MSVGKARSLLANIRLGWKGLPGTNTILLQTFVNYAHKNVITLALFGNKKASIYNFHPSLIFESKAIKNCALVGSLVGHWVTLQNTKL